MPTRQQAIIWTNAGILSIQTTGTNFSEILSEIHTFSFKKIHRKMLSTKWQQFCLHLNVLTLIMLNLYEKTWKYIWISHNSLTLKHLRSLNFTSKDDKFIHSAYSQYHSYWWPGDARSQAINSHDIDLVCQKKIQRQHQKGYQFWTTCQVSWQTDANKSPSRVTIGI